MSDIYYNWRFGAVLYEIGKYKIIGYSSKSCRWANLTFTPSLLFYAVYDEKGFYIDSEIPFYKTLVQAIVATYEFIDGCREALKEMESGDVSL